MLKTRLTKLFILIIAVALTFGCVGGIFALYSTNATPITVSLRPKLADVYTAKLYTDGVVTSTINLVKNTKAEEGVTEYFATFEALASQEIKFFVNDTEITTYADDYYSNLKKNESSKYVSTEKSEYTVYLNVTSEKIYIDAAYYLIMSPDWTVDATTKMVDNPGNPDEVMMLGVTIAANTKLKVKRLSDYWGCTGHIRDVNTNLYTNDAKDNIVLPYAGTYDFYFNKSTGKLYFSGQGTLTYTDNVNTWWTNKADANNYPIYVAQIYDKYYLLTLNGNTLTGTVPIIWNSYQYTIHRIDPNTFDASTLPDGLGAANTWNYGKGLGMNYVATSDNW